MRGRSVGDGRSGKRRLAGLVIAGLGGFLIIAAVLFPTYVVSQVVKFPLNEYETATLTGTNVQYFNAKLLTEEAGVTERATYTIKGVAKNGDSSTACWDEFEYAYDVTNGQEQAASTRRAAFDRKTAQLVNACGANVDGHVVKQSGIVGWVFPFGTQKKTYQVFDETLLRPEPFVFSGTDTTDGVQTYKYVENISPTQATTLTVPGYFVGSSAASVKAPEMYQTHVIYWVDPVTGALVNVNNFEELTVRNPITGVTGTVLYKGDLTMVPQSIQTVVNLDKSGRNELFLLKTLLPIVFGVVGAIAVVVGILLGRRGRGDADTESATMPLSAVAPPAAEDRVTERHTTVSPSTNGTDPAETEASRSPAASDLEDGAPPDESPTEESPRSTTSDPA